MKTNVRLQLSKIHSFPKAYFGALSWGREDMEDIRPLDGRHTCKGEGASRDGTKST